MPNKTNASARAHARLQDTWHTAYAYGESPRTMERLVKQGLAESRRVFPTVAETYTITEFRRKQP